MAAAPVNPSPDDVSTAGFLFEWVRQWGGALFGSGALGGVFLAGRKVSAFEKNQEQHDRSLDEHDKDIAELKAGRTAADIRMAGLVTREDLSRESEATRAEVRAISANLTQLMGTMFTK